MLPTEAHDSVKVPQVMVYNASGVLTFCSGAFNGMCAEVPNGGMIELHNMDNNLGVRASLICLDLGGYREELFLQNELCNTHKYAIDLSRLQEHFPILETGLRQLIRVEVFGYSYPITMSFNITFAQDTSAVVFY